MSDELSISMIAVMALAIILALVLHEIAHGWVASLLGDDTAREQGRLTLNPVSHIDPIGTLLVPAVIYALSGFIFGWARPVPIGWRRLHRPKTDMGWVAFAGPASNFVQALAWAGLLKLAWVYQLDLLEFMASIGIWVNLIIMTINLIPLPPLDGSRIVAAFLPDKAALAINRVQFLGIAVLIVAVVTGALDKYFLPFLIELNAAFLRLVGA